MIEMGKKYQTRDGRAVRILCVDGPNIVWPIVGYIGDSHDISFWTLNGFHGSTMDPSLDLIPLPTKHEMWALMDTHSTTIKGYRYGTKAEADAECRLEPEYNEVVVHVIWET